MVGFWTSEMMKDRFESDNLVQPYEESRVVNCSYELGMGGEIFVTSRTEGTKQVIEDGAQVVIPPGQFAQLLSQEEVLIPADCLGFISIKSKLKFRGLVNVSGFHVDPGYSGRLIFAVYNAGPNPIVLTQGMPAFLLWISSLARRTADTYDRPGRTDISAEDVMLLQGNVATPQAMSVRVDDLANEMKDAVSALTRRVDEVESKRTRRREITLAVAVAVVGALISAGIGFAISRYTSSDPPAQSPPVTTAP
jgi:dCTP deaminase